MELEMILLIPPLSLALYMITKHFHCKLQNLPPSPFLCFPIIGHLHLLKKPLHRSLSKISARHGPVLLLQFGSRLALVVSSSSAAEECFTKNDVVFANRPHLLAGKHIGCNYTSLAWSSHGSHWRNLRKIATVEILSNHRVQMLQDIRTDEAKAMIRRLRKKSEENEVVDLKSVLFELTMNVMMRMIAGKRFYGENVSDLKGSERFKEIVKETFRLGGSSLGDFLPVVKWLGIGGLEKKLEELQKGRDGFMQDLVEECKTRIRNGGNDGENRTKTMIEVLLDLQEKEPEYYTDRIIRSLMLTLLAAGTDTSSGTMEWALSLLLNNPDVLKKAQLEIDNRIGSDRLIEESDITDLPYLNGIVNETLRMYNAGPLLLPHESSEQCVVGGYRVPAGTMLLVNMWAIQNNPWTWEDPGEFKPERFEGLEGLRDSFKLVPFGSGRRGCPGEGLAIRMLCLGLGSLIQCFDWERVGKDLIEMTEGPGITMPKAEPLMAYCKVRSSAVKIISLI